MFRIIEGNLCFFVWGKGVGGLRVGRLARAAGFYQTQYSTASSKHQHSSANKHTFQLYIYFAEIYDLYEFIARYVQSVSSLSLCAYILFNYYYLVIRGLCFRAQYCGRLFCAWDTCSIYVDII